MKKQLFTLTQIIFLIITFLGTNISANAQNGNTGIGSPLPGSKLTINGSFAATYNDISAASYTMTGADYYLSWNGVTTGAITLPAYNTAPAPATSIGGRIYHIRNASTVNNMTVTAFGAELIDYQGAAVSSILLPPGAYCLIVSKGTTSGTTWEVASIDAPPVLLKYKNTAPQTIGNANTIVAFPTLVFDRGNNFNTGTSTFTAPSGGYYWVNVYVKGNSIGTTGIRSSGLFINGVQYENIDGDGISAGDGHHWTASTLVKLNAGDQIDFRMFAIPTFNTMETSLSIMKVAN